MYLSMLKRWRTHKFANRLVDISSRLQTGQENRELDNFAKTLPV